MTMDGGVMKMRPVAGGLEIKPGEKVELKPDGFHLMFKSLKQPLMSCPASIFERSSTSLISPSRCRPLACRRSSTTREDGLEHEL